MNVWEYRDHLSYLIADPPWYCSIGYFEESLPGASFEAWTRPLPSEPTAGYIKEPVRYLEAVIARLECTEAEREQLLAELTLLLLGS